MKKIFNFIKLYWRNFISVFKNKKVSLQTNNKMNLRDIQIEISSHIYNHVHVHANIQWVFFYASIHIKPPIIINTLPPFIKYTQYIFNKMTNAHEIYDRMNFANYDASKQYYEISILDIYEFLINDLQFDIYNLLNPSQQLIVPNIKNAVVGILVQSPSYAIIQTHYNDIIDRLLQSTTQCSPTYQLGTILNGHNFSSRKI